MAIKRTNHIIHDDEIEIDSFQLQLMLGPAYKENIEIAVNSIFCTCGAQSKKLVNFKSYINDLNDVILKGYCNSCNTIAARYIETGERKNIEKIANSIKKLNKA